MEPPWWHQDRYPLLLHRIGILQALDQVPELPENISNVPKRDESSADQPHVLPLKYERRLSRICAYLASPSDDPRKIVAASIQEPSPNSLQINLAVNHGQLDAVVSNFQKVCSTLQEIAAITTKANHNRASQRLHDQVIRLAQARILARLRSRHAKLKCNHKKQKSLQNPLGDFCNVFWSTCRQAGSGPASYKPSKAMKTHVTSLMGAFQRLEAAAPGQKNTDQMCNHLLAIVKHCNRICNIVRGLPPRQSRKLRNLRVVQRLSLYEEIIEFLGKAARKYPVFQAVQVSQVNLQPFRAEKQDFDTWTDKILKKIQSTSSKKDPKAYKARAVCDAPASTFPVHAEVQLLVYHESRGAHEGQPRVISSHKNMCLMCYLLFAGYDRFETSGTHGRLYEKWALPKAIAGLGSAQSAKMSKAIDNMVVFLESRLDALSEVRTKPKPLPLESLVCSVLTMSTDSRRRTHSKESVVELDLATSNLLLENDGTQVALDHDTKRRTARRGEERRTEDGGMGSGFLVSAQRALLSVSEMPRSSKKERSHVEMHPLEGADRNLAHDSNNLSSGLSSSSSSTILQQTEIDSPPYEVADLSPSRPKTFHTPRLDLIVEWQGPHDSSNPAEAADIQPASIHVALRTRVDGNDKTLSVPTIDVEELQFHEDYQVDLVEAPWTDLINVRYRNEVSCLEFCPNF